jgi:PAS domain S-box-containing protein
MPNIDLNASQLHLYLNLKHRETNERINYSVTDEDGIILYANQNFCDTTGYSKEELIGVSHRIISSGYHGAAFYKEMWDTIKAGYIWQGELKNINKSGKEIWFNTLIFPVYDKKNKARRFLAMRTEITAQKKIEAQKQERLVLQKELIYKISHELRQPVTQLMGLIEIMKMGELSNEETNFLIQKFSGAAQMLDIYSREISAHTEMIAKTEHEGEIVRIQYLSTKFKEIVFHK